jgi:hypothetical protein
VVLFLVAGEVSGQGGHSKQASRAGAEAEPRGVCEGWTAKGWWRLDGKREGLVRQFGTEAFFNGLLVRMQRLLRVGKRGVDRKWFWTGMRLAVRHRQKDLSSALSSAAGNAAVHWPRPSKRSSLQQRYISAHDLCGFPSSPTRPVFGFQISPPGTGYFAVS